MRKRKGVAISILAVCVVLCIWFIPFLRKETKLNKVETSIVSPKKNGFLKENSFEDEMFPNAESIDKSNNKKETKRSQWENDNEVTVPESWNK